MQKHTALFIIIMIFTIPLCEATAQRSQYSGLTRYIEEKRVTTLDSAQLRISYSLSYVPDSVNPQKVMKDRKVLLIGGEWMHFYSYYLRQSDSAVMVSINKGKNYSHLKMPAGVADEGYEVFTHIPTQKRTVLEPITDLSLYSYEEPAETPQWVIGDDTCRILSYPCQKATARFRGRDWTVWFSAGVPLNAGPWKLSGLPGLILKAADSRNHYVFECIGIEQLRKVKEPVIMLNSNSNWNYIKCTRAEYRKAQQQFYENHVNTLLSLGFNVVIIDDAGNHMDFIKTPNTMFEERNIMWSYKVDVADRYKKLPYNPIELE